MLENEVAKTAVIKPKSSDFTCKKCHSIGSIITQKFRSADRDSVLEFMLHQCGSFSSFSDACASIVLSYFNDIYDHFDDNLNAENICHMSGSCSDRYHKHDEDELTAETLQLEIRPMSDVGVVGGVKDDIPCELCQQLVSHLK